MNRRWALTALLFAAACALPPPSPDAFTFGVMGDVPYDLDEERIYHRMLERLDRESLEFIVHVGDVKSGSTPCTDALFRERFDDLNNRAHPVLYTPGDNEWTDCRRKPSGSMDPLERLRRLRQIFFADQWSLGQRRIRTDRQDEYPENRSWTHARVRFVTLNVPGSDNNVGFDAASDAEARRRGEANRIWLQRAVEAAERADDRALLLFVQANPWMTRRPGVYGEFIAQVEAAAKRLRRPVLLVHGDSHIFRYDTPFVDALGNPLPNLARLETYGSPQVGWVRVTVDPADPKLFRIEGVLVGVALPGSPLK
jgi:hypothetical protein